MKTNNVDFGKSFKFKHKNSAKNNDVIYTYTRQHGENFATIEWPASTHFRSGKMTYSLTDAMMMVSDGLWIVLPSENTDNSHNTEKSEDNLLDQIKDFTATSKHSVNIYEGVYEVFRRGEDMAYKCNDDETLKKVMGALQVLDGVVCE